MENTILWLKTICGPCRIGMTAVLLIVEDKNGDSMSLPLYNQINPHTKYDDLLKQFPTG